MRKTVFLAGGIVWGVVALIMLFELVAGLNGGGRLLAANSGLVRFVQGNLSLVREESISLADIHRIEIEAFYHSVRVFLTDGAEMTVRQYDTDSDADPKTLFSSSKANGALRVSIAHRIRLMFFTGAGPRLEIDIPRTYAGAVAVKTASGSIRLYDPVKWSDVSIISSSGTIRSNGSLTCAALDVETSSGSVNLGDIRAGSVRIDTSSGTIRLGDVAVRGSAGISSSSGSHHVGDLSAGVFSIRGKSGSMRYSGVSGGGVVTNSSGSINLGRLEVKGEVSVSGSSGTQRMELTGNQNLAVSISTTSGSIRAADLALSYTDNRGRNASATVGSGADGTLNLKSSSGSIIIR